jgi:hypothetical protein
MFLPIFQTTLHEQQKHLNSSRTLQKSQITPKPNPASQVVTFRPHPYAATKPASTHPAEPHHDALTTLAQNEKEKNLPATREQPRLASYCAAHHAPKNLSRGRRGSKKRCLRSQNRTRDLSITTDITVERDKPTTPSGVMQQMLRLTGSD